MSLEVGRYTYGLEGITIHQWDDSAVLRIGSFCSISEDVHVFLGGSDHRTDWITTFPFGHIHTHVFDTFDGTGHPTSRGDVVIGNDVWVGYGVTIMSGVTIGDGAVLAARSHVVRDVPPYAIVGGNPAKVLKCRWDADSVARLLDTRWWTWTDEHINQAAPLLCSGNVDGLVEFALKAGAQNGDGNLMTAEKKESGVRLFVVCHAHTGGCETYDTAAGVGRGVRWYLVNEAKPKTVTVPEELVVREWELPRYDPLQQMCGFYNNSAMWHVYHNADVLLPEDVHVGFSQYDIDIPEDAIREFDALDAPHKVGYMFPHPMEDVTRYSPCSHAFWERVALECGGVAFDELARGRPVPLCHGFLMPRSAFLDMMRCMDGLLPDVLRELGHDTRHLAGTLERVCALWIAGQVHRGILGPAVHLGGCVHDDAKRLHDPVRHHGPMASST